MQVRAKARFIRQSPRKVRLVVDLIRDLPVASARDQLNILSKNAAGAVLKVLNSAVQNAVHNNKLKAEDLSVYRAFVDQGPTIKRFRARAFGRAGAIRKRTSHITIILEEKKNLVKKIEKKADNKKYKK